VLRGERGDGAPVGQPVVDAGDLHVRGDAKDAGADLLLEAVHHREHHDQRHTPTKIPIIDTSELIPMKRLRRLARV